MPDDKEIGPIVAETFRRLAETLAVLPPDRGDEPSLCEGWTVRHVLAHMTMADRYTPEQFAAELSDDGFDFGRLSNRLAEREGARPFSELLASLRGDTMARWRPPGGGVTGALSHVVIHGLDITVALGLPRSPSDDAMRLVLDGLTAGGAHRHFDTSVDGLRLRATDLDWAYGDGPTVEAPAQEIVAALGGRRIPSLTLRAG
jgi:uncharacterized protein (TIGR03083 family)